MQFDLDQTPLSRSYEMRNGGIHPTTGHKILSIYALCRTFASVTQCRSGGSGGNTAPTGWDMAGK
ncbi:hypothetical protein [Pelagibacterium halotolerans]|uniref:hypothetical protein n=1 Tax=Pelagibacterium halotolerans TaxID=531813 RepID=UPI00384DD195